MAFPSQYYTCPLTGSLKELPSDMCEFLNALAVAVESVRPGDEPASALYLFLPQWMHSMFAHDFSCLVAQRHDTILTCRNLAVLWQTYERLRSE